MFLFCVNRKGLFISPNLWYNWKCYRPNTGNRKGASKIEILAVLMITVMANVTSHYICKWLDSKKKR